MEHKERNDDGVKIGAWGAADRILARSNPDADGCLTYTGATGTTGYGQVRVVNPDAPASDRIKRYRTMEAHRVIWIAEHGAVPADTYVRHACGNKRCMNVTHLFLQPARRPAPAAA